MKYLKAYENFNYEPTNEEFLGLFSAKTRNEYIKKGYDEFSKLIASNKELQAKVEELFNQSEELPQSEIQKLQDVIGGKEESKVEELEEVVKKETDSVEESFSDVVEKIKKVLSWVFRFGKQLVWFAGSLAMIILSGTESMGARTILSGEASGNLSFSWYGMLMLIGGVISLILWGADKQMKASGEGPLFGGKK